ncbi:MAG: F-type H+-transporting ATPase subunit b [Myxococcota bacterium]|jgi:F-type H+-transporting ATPase subunit b
MEIFPTPALAAVMVIPFLVTFVALYLILFRPLVAYLDAREGARDGARQETNALGIQVAERTADLQKRLEDARSEVIAYRATERAKALETESEIIADARTTADAHIGRAVTDIRTSAETARQSISTTAATLSTEIAAQVLGRELSA